MRLMVNKYFRIILLQPTFVFFILIFAENVSSAYYTCKVVGLNFPRKLTLIYFPEHSPSIINSRGLAYGAVYKYIVADSAGYFNFYIPPLSDTFRMQIVDDSSQTDLLSGVTTKYYDLFCSQIGERNDSVQFVFDCRNETTKLKASGVGSLKFNVHNEVFDFKIDFVGNGISNLSIDSICSFYNKKIKLLDAYKRKISIPISEMIKYDLYGNLIEGHIRSMYSFDDINSNTPSNSILEAFNQLKMEVENALDTNFFLAGSSPYFCKLIYELTKSELRTRSQTSEFPEIIDYLTSHYSGRLRDATLAYAFYWLPVDAGVLGCDPSVFIRLLDSAKNENSLLWAKSFLSDVSKWRAKGEEALDFNFKRDSSENRVKLSDFRGKVVFVDIWGIPCGGCVHFAQAFHKKIFPKLSERDDFKVISLMADSVSEEKYKFTLQKQIYTFPEYVNLFGGIGEDSMRRALNTHYNITGIPRFMLIDKHGKVFSGTLPFLYEDCPDKKVEEFYNTIIACLNE